MCVKRRPCVWGRKMGVHNDRNDFIADSGSQWRAVRGDYPAFSHAIGALRSGDRVLSDFVGISLERLIVENRPVSAGRFFVPEIKVDNKISDDR